MLIVDYILNQDTTGYDMQDNEEVISFINDKSNYYIEYYVSSTDKDLYFSKTEDFDSLSSSLLTRIFNVTDTSSNAPLVYRDMILDVIDSIHSYNSTIINTETKIIHRNMIYDLEDDGILNDYDYHNLIDSAYDGSNAYKVLAFSFAFNQYSSCYVIENIEDEDIIASNPAVADAAGAYFHIMAGLWNGAWSGGMSDSEINDLIDEGGVAGLKATARYFMHKLFLP